ncbi:magnesium/cobalt transporter CorA [Senegalia sp. (in: firmicutes)]|uniref:magnesium/cobalt transporter CorA n=1 Tax=Senegalia sp. (in: firmicutes) TaxID=1924098 RepID=UPI003F97EC6E
MRKLNLKKIGKAPGTLTYTGEEKETKSILELITYDENHFEKNIINSLDVITNMSESVKWLNIYGINDIETIDEIGEKFNISDLLLEDILSVGQRPKIEYEDDYIFIVMKMLYFNEDRTRIEEEQISFILKENFLLTFQEKEGDVFDLIRKSLSNSNSDDIKYGEDYLLYLLLDTIVDKNYLLLKELEYSIDKVEVSVMEEEYNDLVKDIHVLRRELVVIKTAISPMNQIVYELMNKAPIISKEVRNYLKDVNDHIVQIMDFISIYRETVNSLFDTKMSDMSNRMNKIMTTLTLYSTIFIPLSFLTGVYGMNFKYMPELDDRISYPLFWVIAISLAIGMILFFKKKKWL